VAFNVQNAGLDVPGGNPVNILLTSPAFAAQKAGFIAGLGAAGIEQDSTPYDVFIGIARWILDPADPTNAAFFTIHKTGIPSVTGGDSIPATRRTFVQWILDDQVVPNPTTRQMIEAALHQPGANAGDLPPVPSASLFRFQFNPTTVPIAANGWDQIPACNRHGFLLRPPSATCGGTTPSGPGALITGQAQGQIVTFIAGGAPY
jgi:hypothetical protein